MVTQRRRRRLVGSCCVALAALATSWSTHENDFVWDDYFAIQDNRDTYSRGHGTDLWQLWRHDFWGADIQDEYSHKSFRPITTLSFRWNHWWHGLWPRGYHVVNSWLHAACSVLVLWTGSALFDQYESSNLIDPEPAAYDHQASVLLASLLFAVHPVHCDSVASIVGRADLLCTAFSLLGFHAYRCAAAAGRLTTHWGAFAFALALTVTASLCKELGFTTFGLFFAYDLIRAASQPNAKQAFRECRLRLGVLTAFTVLSMLLRVALNGQHRNKNWLIAENHVVYAKDRSVRWLSYAHIHAWYLWKLLWPRWLTFDYGFNTIPNIAGFSDTRNLYTLAAYAVVLLGIAIAIRGIKRSPLLMFIAFGAIPFVPASHVLFPVGTIVAERLLYFPSIGFCLLVGHVLGQALQICYTAETSKAASSRTMIQLCRWLRRLILVSCSLLLICAWYKSQVRNAEWKTDVSLYEAALHVTPTNIKVLANVGSNAIHSDPDRGMEILRIGVNVLPNHVDCHINLGVANMFHDNTLFAIRHFHKALTFDPISIRTMGALGGQMYQFWQQEHRTYNPEEYLGSPTIAAAERYLDDATTHKSMYPLPYLMRGIVAFHGGDFERALEFAQETLRVNELVLYRNINTAKMLVDELTVYSLMADALRNLGRVEDAVAIFTQTIELFPGRLEPCIDLALLHIHQEESDLAAQYLQQALDLANSSDHGLVLLAASRLLESQLQYSSAALFSEKAMALLSDQSEYARAAADTERLRVLAAAQLASMAR